MYTIYILLMLISTPCGQIPGEEHHPGCPQDHYMDGDGECILDDIASWAEGWTSRDPVPTTVPVPVPPGFDYVDPDNVTVERCPSPQQGLVCSPGFPGRNKSVSVEVWKEEGGSHLIDSFLGQLFGSDSSHPVQSTVEVEEHVKFCDCSCNYGEVDDCVAGSRSSWEEGWTSRRPVIAEVDRPVPPGFLYVLPEFVTLERCPSPQRGLFCYPHLEMEKNVKVWAWKMGDEYFEPSQTTFEVEDYMDICTCECNHGEVDDCVAGSRSSWEKGWTSRAPVPTTVLLPVPPGFDYVQSKSAEIFRCPPAQRGLFCIPVGQEEKIVSVKASKRDGSDSIYTSISMLQDVDICNCRCNIEEVDDCHPWRSVWRYDGRTTRTPVPTTVPLPVPPGFDYVQPSTIIVDRCPSRDGALYCLPVKPEQTKIVSVEAGTKDNSHQMKTTVEVQEHVDICPCICEEDRKVADCEQEYSQSHLSRMLEDMSYRDPVPTTVPLPVPPGFDYVQPKDVLILRCPSAQWGLICFPTKQEQKKFSVEARKRDGSDPKKRTAEVAEHVDRCTCRCLLKNEDCPERREVDEESCTCECKETIVRMCSYVRRRFSDESCACNCKDDDREACEFNSQGLTWSEGTCKCS